MSISERSRRVPVRAGRCWCDVGMPKICQKMLHMCKVYLFLTFKNFVRGKALPAIWSGAPSPLLPPRTLLFKHLIGCE